MEGRGGLVYPDVSSRHRFFTLDLWLVLFYREQDKRRGCVGRGERLNSSNGSRKDDVQIKKKKETFTYSTNSCRWKLDATRSVSRYSNLSRYCCRDTRPMSSFSYIFVLFFSLSPKRIKNKLFPFDLPSILSIYRARQDLHFTTRQFIHCGEFPDNFILLITNCNIENISPIIQIFDFLRFSFDI